MHSDGGTELVSDKILTFLHHRVISTSHTPRDTPEMNSTVERRVCDIKERAYYQCSFTRDSRYRSGGWPIINIMILCNGDEKSYRANNYDM